MQHFWNKVNKTEYCWNWIGAKRGKNGYGAFKFNGVVCSPHRVAYELENGPIPNGKNVCHHCDNRLCVRLDHLFLGTQSENMKDAFSKGRIELPEGEQFKRGEDHPNRKLTDKEIEEIKRLPSAGLRQIAQKYGVDHSRIWQIINQK